mmetsp:Transcript_144930/g.252769  ORF Transcript_144930/g.252769 Transcript_144930/m.252769 type:complete len:216 (-) Transcript_144930:219-866(-)
MPIVTKCILCMPVMSNNHRPLGSVSRNPRLCTLTTHRCPIHVPLLVHIQCRDTAVHRLSRRTISTSVEFMIRAGNSTWVVVSCGVKVWVNGALVLGIRVSARVEVDIGFYGRIRVAFVVKGICSRRWRHTKLAIGPTKALGANTRVWSGGWVFGSGCEGACKGCPLGSISMGVVFMISVGNGAWVAVKGGVHVCVNGALVIGVMVSASVGVNIGF